MSKIYTAADQLIGHTPLLELTHIEKEADLKATVLAKLEYFNPAGSVKDRIAKAMVDEGVIKAEDVQRIHPKKQIAGIIVSALVLAVLIYTCAKSAPWGYACGGVATVVGFLKYRSIVQYNSLTVKRFRNTYKEDMDVKKFNKFVETHF